MPLSHAAALLALACFQQAPEVGKPAAPAADATPAAPAAPRTVPPRVDRDNAALPQAMAALAGKYPTLARVRTIGKSAGGTPIDTLVLSSAGDQADGKPGILVVAGSDGVRWAGTEAALMLAEKLLASHAELLGQVTVFVVPRANPDAAAAYFSTPRWDTSANAMRHDNDRDRKIDENGPQDLNGDGLITTIRAKGLVAPYANPTMVADAADPRILRSPDPLKGEVAEYTVLVEGIDLDGDGRIAEDGPGGVVPDRNFPHRWPEFEDQAGAFPLVAPEAKALAQFVLKHPSLVGAVFIGRHDTVVNMPDGRARAEGGTPMVIGEDDAKYYGSVAKVWRDQAGAFKPTESDTSGSLAAWMNAQRGIPTFAVQLNGKPEAPAKPSTDAKDKPAEGESAAPAAASAPADGQAAPAPARGEGAPRQGRGGRGRGGAPATPDRAPAAPQQSGTDEAAWLALSDSQGGAGFVAWTPFMHPQLGAVEIGGWIPGWRENPSIADVPALGDRCAALVAAVAEHRAVVSIRKPTVTMLAPGVIRVDSTLSNTGKLPSIQQGGRAGDVTPAHVVRISTPVDRVKSGQRMFVVRGLTPGETRPLSWIVQAPPDEEVTLDLLFMGSPIESYVILNGEVIK
jgi:hypothetical protein